jgi:ABC-type branched-subunit amino acid transport system substrate-binding protein
MGRPRTSWIQFCRIAVFAALTGSLAAYCANPADFEVKGSEIVIGQCAALTGPAAGLGTGMNLGLRAAFEESNAAGGIHGRRLRLISEDDGYEPEKCVDCTSKMIEEQGVFALAGYVGTPTAKVAAPIVQETNVPIIGLFTGAMLLRQPVQRYVINIRASYDDETEAIVEYLTKVSGRKKIAVFYQNDSFGLSGLAGVEKALAARKMALAGKGSFERNTAAVKSGLATIIESAPDAVVIISPYRPAAEFLRQARAASLKADFATISFVGTENLIAESGDAANGILISQVVPSPSDDRLPLVKAYLAALKKVSAESVPSYVSFEGYVTGRLLIAALDRAGQALTREKLIDTVEGSGKFELGGMSLGFSAANHQGSSAVFLTRVDGGKARSIDAR